MNSTMQETVIIASPAQPNRETTRQPAPWVEIVIEQSIDIIELLSQQESTEYLYQLHQQLDAQLDCLRIAGATAWQAIAAQLEAPNPGLVFLATVLTLESQNTLHLKQLLSLAEAEPELQPALLQGFAWVPAQFTQPIISHLLAATPTFYKLIGLHLCRQHQIHADSTLEWAVIQPDNPIQIMGLDAAGEIGMIDLLPQCLKLLAADQEDIAYHAARACLLLGERNQALGYLKAQALTDTPYQKPALSLLAVFLPVAEAQQFLSTLAKQASDKRLLVQLAGELGDPASIPALLRLMGNPELSRSAGSAFSFITGLDLVADDLEAPAPPDAESERPAGPNDDPEDDNVESDPDENLPWPHQTKLMQWWEHNSHQFTPGSRYIQGKEITQERCLAVLASGNQPLREIAALHLKRINPASHLFLVDAPAWRQASRLSLLKNS